MTTPDPWERTTDETPQAWEAFTAYRDLGIARSLAKVGKALGKSTTLIEGWSVRHGWVARVEAWDAEQDRDRRAEHAESLASMTTRHVTVAQKMLDIVTKRLETLRPEDLTPHQLARLARDAVSIERMALGEPTGPDPANGEDPRVSLVESMRRWFEDREMGAFLEGAAAAQESQRAEEPG